MAKTTEAVRLDPKPSPKVVGIEGGRALKARRVSDQFYADGEELMQAVGMPAGYAIVAWDDEGMMQSVLHRGERCPYAPSLLPNLIRDMVKADTVIAAE